MNLGRICRFWGIKIDKESEIVSKSVFIYGEKKLQMHSVEISDIGVHVFS